MEFDKAAFTVILRKLLGESRRVEPGFHKHGGIRDGFWAFPCPHRTLRVQMTVDPGGFAGG